MVSPPLLKSPKKKFHQVLNLKILTVYLCGLRENVVLLSVGIFQCTRMVPLSAPTMVRLGRVSSLKTGGRMECPAIFHTCPGLSAVLSPSPPPPTQSSSTCSTCPWTPSWWGSRTSWTVSTLSGTPRTLPYTTACPPQSCTRTGQAPALS